MGISFDKFHHLTPLRRAFVKPFLIISIGVFKKAESLSNQWPQPFFLHAGKLRSFNKSSFTIKFLIFSSSVFFASSDGLAQTKKTVLPILSSIMFDLSVTLFPISKHLLKGCQESNCFIFCQRDSLA